MGEIYSVGYFVESMKRVNNLYANSNRIRSRLIRDMITAQSRERERMRTRAHDILRRIRGREWIA